MLAKIRLRSLTAAQTSGEKKTAPETAAVTKPPADANIPPAPPHKVLGFIRITGRAVTEARARDLGLAAASGVEIVAAVGRSPAARYGGLSCNQAAKQFGIGISTAIGWVRRLREWAKYQKRIEPERLVFIDETWTRTDMAPLRGWAPRGHRLTGKVPHGRWKTMTFLAALRHDRVEAPWLLEGPINGDSFRLYVEKVLLPTLRPGDLVIMDNLGSHKSRVVRQLIRSAGARLFFLPKYSPDLNPIEQVFAKLKHRLRKVAARTVEAICTALGKILQGFTPDECANYFASAGYKQT